MDVALELENLSKTYKVGFNRIERRAVVDVSLSVPTGTVFGLLGPNGAGKTTTIKMTVGFLRPDSGSAYIYGIDSREAEARTNLGFLPESPYFHPHFTAEKALHFFGKLFGMGRADRKERVEELLDLVGLSDEAKLPLSKFSKGMLQRLGIAQALINDPELLIVDEPTSGLDPIGQVEMRSILKRLNQEEGKTILLSSHYLAEVEELCDEVAFINKGEVVARGKIGELLDAGGVYSIIATGLPKSWRPIDPPAKLERENGCVRLVVEKCHVDGVLDTVRTSGGLVEEVRRVTRSLEEYFMEIVGVEEGGD